LLAPGGASNEERTLLVVEGDGGTLALAAWNGEQWSEPQGLRFDIEDPRRQVPVYLSNLYAALVDLSGGAAATGAEAALAVVGTDEMGDVWAVLRGLETLETVFTAPSPWSPPVAVSESRSSPGLPAVVSDSEGRVHVLWAEAESEAQSTTALWYARWERARWSRPAVVLRSPEGGAREPTLALLGDDIHALWSGGPDGQIWYSRAFVQDAYAAGGWGEPRTLWEADAVTTTNVGSRPEAVAAGGRLHVVYAVPVNERRGVFYTSSADGGETWDPPSAVFDAAEAAWTAVDAPQPAVDLQGGLHVLWLRPALSANEPAQGVYYAWSRDGGESWSEPLVVAEGPSARPRITVNGLNQVHILWQDLARGDAWWHRWLPDASVLTIGVGDWAGWSRNQQVVGLRDVTGSLGLAPDGDGRLHLIGLRSDELSLPSLVHVLWDGERWEQQEELELELEPADVGAAAALPPEGGQLDVVFGAGAVTSESTAEAELWYTGRAVPPASLIYAVDPAPTATPTPSPTPTPGPSITPTPDLSGGPAPAGQSSPLPVSTSVFVAGGLAVLLVLGVFGSRLLWARRQQ
jgi:hypothetical protein